MKIKRIGKMGFQLEVLNPFILCAHHKDMFPKGNGKMGPSYFIPGRVVGSDFNASAPWRMYHGSTIPGFPVHPHRGFETVTIMMEGYADHFDSKGSKGRYGQGDVQWMTAGAGVQHSEMFPLLSDTEDNPMHLFQIWLNLPAKDKFAKPDYKMMWSEKIPEVKESNEGKEVSVRVIAGEYKDTKAIPPLPASWAFDPDNHVSIWLIDMDADAQFKIPAVSPTLSRGLYFYQGDSIQIEDKEIEEDHYILLDGNEEITIQNGKTKARLLLLEGEPINEPIAAHGPFVMNTREELMQAFMDYERTQFGGWPWSRQDPVNDKSDNRFASYNNGERVERP